jgi:NAD(P)-dependent dehydrogenase (short-subunit alcohol dehydrogenase family)
VTGGALAGNAALVTGAGRGIGRSIALGLVKAGANVVIVARSEGQLASVAAEAWAMRPSSAVTVSADLGDPAQLEALAGRALAGLSSIGVSSIDILINNAAVVTPLGATLTQDLAEVRRAFDVNVLAPIALTGTLVPAMLEGGWGRVVNISSGVVATPEGMVGGNVYVQTKAALEAHTRNLAAELADSGVTVHGYRPGAVDTAMQDYIRAQPPEAIGQLLHDQFVSMHASGSLVSPDLSATQLLRRLSSNETGQIWSVDDAV